MSQRGSSRIRPGSKKGAIRSIDLVPTRVQPGSSEVRITIAPPPGNAFNSSVPFELHVTASGAAVDLDPSSLHLVSSAPRFPHAIPARFRRGEGRIIVDVIAYYCDDEETRLCCYQHVRLNLLVKVQERADEKFVNVIHRLDPPEVSPA